MQFDQSCYSVLKRVPRGRVTTYRQIAEALGTKAYRAVGGAMRRNRNAPKVPCHRVVRSDGGVGGYSKGQREKIRLLRMEGVIVKNNRVDLDLYGYKIK